MRLALCLLFFAAIAAAQETPGKAERKVVRLFGGPQAWGRMPGWQQKDILER